MSEIETWLKLKGIENKMQKNGFVLEKDILFFDDWVITDYVFSPRYLGTIEIAGITFLSSSFPSGVKLCYLRADKNINLCIQQKDIQAVFEKEKESRTALMSMGTVFAYLPDDLNNYQMTRLAHQESLLSYAAPYIMRGVWGKKICSLPRMDNRIKPELNAYSECWLRIYKLCLNCRDLLSDEELQRIPRAWDWLKLIVHEHRKSLLDYLRSSIVSDNITRKENTNLSEEDREISDDKEDNSFVSNYISCEENADNLREYAKLLEQGVEIPVSKQNSPYTYRLMEICISLAGIADVFRHDFWQPYLTSVKSWADMIDRSPNILSVSCAPSGNIKHHRQGTGAKRKCY